MKKITLFCFLIVTTSLFSQNKEKALENVETYIKIKTNSFQKYSRVKVHEFFEQQSAETLPLKEKPSAPIKYSLSLTYKLNDSLIDFSYFHLDKDLNVVAVSTKDEMMKLSEKEDEGILAMLMNPDKGVATDSSETTSVKKLKNKKFKKQVTYEKDGILFIYEYNFFSNLVDENYLSSNIMYPSDSPLKKFGIALRKSLDTCKETSISFNALTKAIKIEGETEEEVGSYMTYLIYDLHRKYLKEGKIKIEDLKTNVELQNMVVKQKNIHFPKYTRLVTTFLTEDGKEIDSFRFDDYSK